MARRKMNLILHFMLCSVEILIFSKQIFKPVNQISKTAFSSIINKQIKKNMNAQVQEEKINFLN